MFGSYAPFIRGAGQLLAAGTALLAGGLGMLADPTRSVGMYMNPYQTEVIDRAMADISRAGDIQRQGIGAKSSGCWTHLAVHVRQSLNLSLIEILGSSAISERNCVTKALGRL